MNQPEASWGPRPAGPPLPAPPEAKRSGCLIALMAGLGLLSLPFLLYTGQSPSVGVVGACLFIGSLAYFANLCILKPGRARRALQRNHRDLRAWHESRPQLAVAQAEDALVAARDISWSVGGGAFLGISPDNREWQTAGTEHAVLVLGPPRSGKTASVIVPSILNAAGPVVSTATKRDVMEATFRSRSRYGRVWMFDPSGREPTPDGVLTLQWTPVWSARTWDGARATAEAMVNASAVVMATGGAGAENPYWTEAAKALLGPMLHAAALSRQSIAEVRRWILHEDYATPSEVLTARGAGLAADDLHRVARTEARERGGIVNATATVLRAYGSERVMARCGEPNFDVDRFVDSTDTVYIVAPAQEQDMVAPLTVGLLEEIRHAVYRRDSPPGADTSPPMLWALDEIANLAPIKTLASIVSDGGGRGLQLMACFQDLTQASVRWGKAAGGFLTVFGTKVIFPGIGDRETLEALSMMVGDWDRPYVVSASNDGHSTGFALFPHRTTSSGTSATYSTRREVLLSPGEIANIPQGHALVVRSGRWGLIEHTPFFRSLPWTAVLAQSPDEVIPRGGPDILLPPPTA